MSIYLTIYVSIKVGLVAMVLGSPPEGNYASVEKYYQLICPQIIDILHNQVRNRNLFFIHIVFFQLQKRDVYM